MIRASKKDIASAVLREFGRTFSQELGIDPEQNNPSTLFQLLVFSLLAGARISHNAAMSAALALKGKGWTTARKMAGATWRERTDVLNRSGYARYDESTSRELGDTCDLLLEKYGGDLRKLREQAGHDPKAERQLLKEFKGIGDVGANIFFREVQAAWDEWFPYADALALKAADRLGLGKDVHSLLRLTNRKEFPHLVAGLVRVQLEDGYQKVLDSAGKGPKGRQAA